MAMTLPNLDDVTWEQLIEEARALIPAYAPEWTNFNPSDPGITLLELLAYFTEALLYRTNRIGDAQTIKFLRLLNGPDWHPRKPLDEERRASLLALAKPLRAVTVDDYEAQAIAAMGRAGRAKCVPQRNLEYTDAAQYSAAAPGHFSVVVLPQHGSAPSKSLLHAVKVALEAASLLTTKVHVVPPVFLAFDVRLTIVKDSRASTESVGSAALSRLQEFFDPLRGGMEKTGWPFGRDVRVSELYRLLGAIPGVDYVTRSTDGNSGDEMEEVVVDAAQEDRLQYNDHDDLQSVRVREEELVKLQIAPGDIVVRDGAGR